MGTHTQRLQDSGLVAWWSHGTTARAGVGVVAQAGFIRSFSDAEPQWAELVPGRAAVLRLRGPQGALDIAVTYFPTGSKRALEESSGDDRQEGADSLVEQRRQMRHQLAAAPTPPHLVLTLLSGDFNYVTVDEDRWCKVSGEATGARDAREEREFQSDVAKPFALHELHQPFATFNGGYARSRLDRVYSSHHAADKLDRDFDCSPLEWVQQLSCHRPVVFHRRASHKSGRGTGALPAAPISAPEWPLRVALCYQSQLHQDERPSCPLRRLRLLKRAIAETTWSMHEQELTSRRQPATA